MKLVHWLLGGRSPPRPLLSVPNVTAHPLTASVPITVLLYNGTLPCGFNVPIKGLTTCCFSDRGQVVRTHTRTAVFLTAREMQLRTTQHGLGYFLTVQTASTEDERPPRVVTLDPGGYCVQTERCRWMLSHGLFGAWRIHTLDSSYFSVCTCLPLTTTINDINFTSSLQSTRRPKESRPTPSRRNLAI